jgi:hypothetical protein
MPLRHTPNRTYHVVGHQAGEKNAGDEVMTPIAIVEKESLIRENQAGLRKPSDSEIRLRLSKLSITSLIERWYPTEHGIIEPIDWVRIADLKTSDRPKSRLDHTLNLFLTVGAVAMRCRGTPFPTFDCRLRIAVIATVSQDQLRCQDL